MPKTVREPSAPAPKTLREAILALIPEPYPTKKALAEAAKITETTLHNILRGDSPSSPTLAKLQRAGVRVANEDVIESLDGAA
jgi:transcriptional regulator with XRE-family HTH domain